MRPALAILATCQLLGGCAVVVVQADGGKPHLSAYPLGVRIDRGQADAVGVKQWSLGLWQSCSAAGIGLSSSYCVVIDPKSCTAAIIDGSHSGPAARGILSKIARQAEFDCLGQQKDHP